MTPETIPTDLQNRRQNIITALDLGIIAPEIAARMLVRIRQNERLTARSSSQKFALRGSTEMNYYTAGGWIQAFLKAMNDLLAMRSGVISAHGLRFRAGVCNHHVNCVLVEFDGHQEHNPFREHDPVYAAKSLLNHYRRQVTR